MNFVQNWPTPLASDSIKRQFSQKALASRKRFVEENRLGGASGIQEMAAVEFSNWHTPTTADAFAQENGLSVKALAKAPIVDCNAKLAAREFSNWMTPRAADALMPRFKDESVAKWTKRRREVHGIGGYSDNTGVAVGEFGLRPNSLLSLWLMGFPRSWLD